MADGERILVVAAHPDDEVLGCGGTIARFVALGHQVRVMFLAEGITARYDPPEFERPDVVAQIERRNANGVRALGILGVPAESVFLSQRYCCRLDQVPQIELVKDIEGHIREFEPTRILTHGPSDANVDHRLAHSCILPAVRPLGGPRIRAIYGFEVLSSTEWNPTAPFPATAFFDISEWMDAKLNALRAYEDELREAPHPRSESVVRALAAYRGAQVGVQYAEGFMLVRALDV